MNTVSNGRNLIVQSFGNTAQNTANVVTPQAEQPPLTPQTVDLKNPTKFISFFQQMIEPKLMAKSGVPQQFGAAALNPTASVQQVTPTQQHFQLDIPFAKSASADPNCKTPNGARVGINFSFF